MKKVCLKKIDNCFYFRFSTLVSIYSIVLKLAQLNVEVKILTNILM